MSADWHQKQRQLLHSAEEIFGDDTSTILNALHELAATIALTCGVEPENFINGAAYHWNRIVDVGIEEEEPLQ